jgi:hypothetical protein
MRNHTDTVISDRIKLPKQKIIFKENTSEIYLSHPNHPFKTSDIISLNNFTPTTTTLNVFDDNDKECLQIPTNNNVGADFMKVYYNHNLNCLDQNCCDYLQIALSDIKGVKNNDNKSYFCGIPLVLLNTHHKILLQLDKSAYTELALPDDYFDASDEYFFIMLPIRADTTFRSSYNITAHNFNITRYYVGGNSFDRLTSLKDGCVIKSVDNSGYTISFDSAFKYDDTIYADDLYVAKVLNTKLCGDINNYVFNLGKTYSNICQVRLCSTEFPNMQNGIVIRSGHNNFYWSNFESEGLYRVSIPSGYYLPDEFATTLAQIVNKVPRNNHQQGYSKYHHIELSRTTKGFKITSFKYVDLVDPYIINNNNSITIRHVAHGIVTAGTIIRINEYHKISHIVDADHYIVITNTTIPTQLPLRIYFPQMFNICYAKCPDLCKTLGITNSVKYCTEYEAVLSINKFDYFYMILKPFKTFETVKVGSYPPFAKIQLGTNNNECRKNDVLYNTFVDVPKIYNEPIQTLSTLEISYADPYGNAFDFGNLDHSFTLEIVVLSDMPDNTIINPNTMKNYSNKVLYTANFNHSYLGKTR